MTIFFAKPAHQYPSYDDFWRLVEVSGFPVVSFDEVDLTKARTYIFTPWNGEVAERLPQLRAAADKKADKDGVNEAARVIWWNLERDLADVEPEARTKRLDDAAKLVDEIWVSDRYYASLDPRFRHVVLGGHPGFADLKAILFRDQPRWLATLYAYIWGRRQLIADALAGNAVALAPDAWSHETRAEVLANTAVMVNTHQYDNAQIIAPIRFAVAASYGMPVVSEPLEDPFPLVEGEHFFEAPTERLGPSVHGLYEARLWWGQNLYKLLVEEHRFDKVVRATLSSPADGRPLP